MKFGSLKYAVSENLGDEIQTLAAEQYLGEEILKVERDALREFSSNDNLLVIMNGWFSGNPSACLPASPKIHPVFVSFHVSGAHGTDKVFSSDECLRYFRTHGPIGCRDRHTLKFFKDRDVDAYYSKCLTLTFPKRSKSPENGKVFVVDAFDIPLPPSIRDGASYVTHSVPDFYGDTLKSEMARKLLATYRDEARLVITTKIHCAMPCLAMGIPVIFFGDANDCRFSPLADLGLPIYPTPSFLDRYRCKVARRLKSPRIEEWALGNQVNWDPLPLDIEQETSLIRQRVEDLVEKVVAKAG